jgi:PilZ domain
MTDSKQGDQNGMNRKSPYDIDDRRANTRHASSELGTVLARVLGRCDARLIDVSRRGVLFESEARLTIGAKTTIRITTTDTSIALKGLVVRSRVATLGKSVVYQTALELDEDLTLVDTLHESRNGTVSTMIVGQARQVETLTVDELGNIHASDGDVVSGEQVEFVTTVPHDFHELQRRAGAHKREAIL